jgi:hypothetical protein
MAFEIFSSLVGAVMCAASVLWFADALNPDGMTRTDKRVAAFFTGVFSLIYGVGFLLF